MILGIGIDIIHLPRIKDLLTRKPTSLLQFSKRILSDRELKEFNERDELDNNVKFLAVRWTLKEAAYKALFPYHRKPQLIIHEQKQEINISNVHSSVSHDGEYVISQVLIEGTTNKKF
ncbi:2455_t:CDS:2 [Funneliformis caledonium]|uniref:2455_t:CDS:1 n=1 Tax=Funneliformis caledonium TaxID=1117310 RepID=A0A9N9B3I8_9GLOM|nr:2455_t:CDS:2 [Funneliformis caledonium]